MTETSLKVDGMRCVNCSAAIDRALNLLPGVESRTDHVAGLVRLKLADVGQLPQIRQTIQDLGFDVVE